MRIQGMSEQEIAAAFFVSVNVLKQRLRLACVAPSLLDLYAEDGVTLGQLMAFNVNPDRAQQEHVWEAIKDGWSEPRTLTETTVRTGDSGRIRRRRCLLSCWRHRAERICSSRTMGAVAGCRAARPARRRQGEGAS